MKADRRRKREQGAADGRERIKDETHAKIGMPAIGSPDLGSEPLPRGQSDKGTIDVAAREDTGSQDRNNKQSSGEERHFPIIILAAAPRLQEQRAIGG